MAMKIRIKENATNTSYWYANKVGEVIEAKEIDLDGDYTIDNGRYVRYGHAEEVIEHNSQLYRKVDRPVREGDTVLITDANMSYGMYKNGDVIRCDGVKNYGRGIYSKQASYPDGNAIGLVTSKEFVVIEPIEPPVQPSAPSYAEVSELLHEAKGEPKEESDLITHSQNELVEVNGKQYRKVKRRAAVGELVVVTDFKPEKHIPDFENTKNGTIFTANYIWTDGDIDTGENAGVILTPEEYSVLELVEQSGQLETLTELDLIANLAQEVAELKRQLTNAQTDIADLEDRVDENEKDVEEVIGRINDLGDGVEANAVDFKALIESLTKMMFDTRDAADYYRTIDLPQTAMHQSGISRGLDIAITKIEGALRNG